MTEAAIRINDVVKKFRRTKVLDAINLEVGAGERIALIGSNGAGKTTLIRCLLGEYVYEGRILVNGLEPRRNRTSVLGAIGFVPQLPPPLKMSVGQLIRFAASLCGTSPQKIFDLSKRLGLDASDILSRQFVRLSGGMKQKLLIAIALGRDANLLIMDEPAANLDPEARKTFFDLLAERLDTVTMILSSHRLDEVSALVNRVVEMDMGKVVLDDTVADAASLTSVLDCRIAIRQVEPAFEKTIESWRFAANADRLVWTGEVAGADRLRFLGIVSRYTALITDLSLSERS